MAVEIVMPRFGWTMEEGLLAEWTKHDGDTVQVGDVLFTVESDKALNEVESFDSGVLRIPPDSPPIGTMVKVGARLAYIVQPGERAPFQDQAAGAPAAVKTPTSAAAGAAGPSAAPAPAVRLVRHAVSPRARRLAAELKVDVERLRGSGRTGRVIERDVRAAGASQPAPAEVRASPVARRAAAELGINLEQVAAARPGQRLQRADVEAAAQQAAATAGQPASPAARPANRPRQ